MSSSTIDIDENRRINQLCKQMYLTGKAAGYADAQARIEIAEMQADYWYYIANNPGAVEAERKRNLSFLELREARAEADRRRRWWDEQEQQLFQQAREMIAAGEEDDLTIAVALGLFLPIVANLRAGVL